MAVIPSAPAGVTVDQLATRFNIKTEGEPQRVYDLAVVTLNRALAGAFRDVPPAVYDDLFLRVAGAIVGVRKRPTTAGGSGQLTTVEQDSGPAVPRDYLASSRATIAQYVVPL